ncbi:sensor domain-containing diguanylate cyclase [Desulfovibrio psychrotolerans]|nr:sensor domain-containing diguanylate cyclase [Desulfovibrio psychrotolerans]
MDACHFERIAHEGRKAKVVVMKRKGIHAYVRFYSILLVALPLLVILGVSMFFFRGLVLEREVSRLREHVQYQERYVSDWLQQFQRGVEFVAGSYVVRAGDEGETQDIFVRYLGGHKDVAAAVRISATGYTVVDSSSPVGLLLADREYFNAARQGKAWISDVLIGRSSGKPIMIFSHPVSDLSGAFDGCVFFSVRMATVQAFLNTISGSDTGESYLLGADGVMLTESHHLDELRRSGFDKETAVKNLTVRSALFDAAREGVVLGEPYKAYHGRTVVGAYTWVNDGRWLLVTEVPLDAVLGGFYRFLWMVGGISAVCLALITPLLMRFTRSIEQPLYSIVDFSRSMARGEYDRECCLPELDRAPAEIAELYESFCEMNAKVVSTIEELERVAITDQLTGVYNRRHLMSAGEKLVDVCRRGGAPCGCLMLDVDHFKRVNDSYGHAVGDMVLTTIADTLQKSVRGSDIVARYGGEEFAIVAPNADREEAARLAERIRAAVEGMSFNADGVRFVCTVSVGVSDIGALSTVGATLLESALNCADVALYKAKDAGRNRVVCLYDC